MYMKSPPYQQMYTQSPYPHTMYPAQGMQPMMPKKKGFLAKLFQKRNPAADYMSMMPPHGQLETYSNTPYQQNHPYMQPPPQQRMMQPPPQQRMMQPPPQQRMMQPQMMAPNETRGAENETRGTAGSTPVGIGSFFTNFISNPTGMLNNVEKVVQMAQSFGPVVQQYGPIVRNIPSIMKILSSGKSTEENQTEVAEKQTEVAEVSPSTPSKEIPITRKPLAPKIIIEDETTVENVQSTTPKPKLYV
ncbi:YqfQ family protein [Bacillus cereus group sp. BfR-BA-01380]|uniref:YqfQ family protein n=1 Tax=Bacillus cereus group sp. BfR-BA-01380 TaxID=2920324 RepID=UPI001F5A2429|nr:YqfQ family protein [Bacillus cereus group sp. BfR-BA-01380]